MLLHFFLFVATQRERNRSKECGSRSVSTRSAALSRQRGAELNICDEERSSTGAEREKRDKIIRVIRGFAPEPPNNKKGRFGNVVSDNSSHSIMRVFLFRFYFFFLRRNQKADCEQRLKGWALSPDCNAV